MTTISKRDALQLAADIRHAKVAGAAIAERTRQGSDAATYGFLGGLESVLQHFIAKHAGNEAATAVTAAMNHAPSFAEIEAQNAKIDSWRTGVAS